jgi:hypothetical protein
VSGPEGTSTATASTPNRDTAPLARHIAVQSPPPPSSPATKAADTAIPTPTPAKCSAARPGRRASASRSSTRAEARISASALATPPRKRSTRNPGTDPQNPIAPVVAALAASAPSSQTRRDPGNVARMAPRAPAKYPAKFADAIRPAVDLLKPSATNIGGRIGV